VLPEEGGKGNSLVTVLAPIRDSLGDVVAVVEFTSLLQGQPSAWN